MEIEFNKAIQNIINVCAASNGNLEYHEILRASLARLKQELELVTTLKAELEGYRKPTRELES